MFKKSILIGMATACIWAQLATAADLTTFKAGEPISSADINQNFTALNDNLPVTGPNNLIIGDTQIVYGVLAIPGATWGSPPIPSSTSVSFSKSFASQPVVTSGYMGDSYAVTPEITNITNSGFSVINGGVSFSLNYIAIGKI